MRLIVSYTVGDDYTYSCDAIVPCVYESADRLLVDLEEAVSFYQLGHSKAMDIRHEFDMTCGHLLEEEWMVARRKLDVLVLALEGPKIFEKVAALYLEHFIEDGKFLAPEVFTVDEWFASKGVIE